MKVLWTFNAQRDLNEIWEYIAADNIDAADALVEKLRRASTLLTGRPVRAAAAASQERASWWWQGPSTSSSTKS
jgi:plasmid stabilization system protein ParE